MAIIVNKNHTVIKYLVNGRPRYVVERVGPNGPYVQHVAKIKRVTKCGDDWASVYNAVDKWTQGGITPSLEKAIDKLSY